MNLIIFPDYKEQAGEKFAELLINANNKKPLVVAGVVNGNDIKDEKIGNYTKFSSGQYLKLYSNPGFNNAITKGITFANLYDFKKIIKIDTAEHDINLISDIINQLNKFDLVVNDMKFSENDLIMNSSDFYHNTYVMPQVIDIFTKNKLELSGAHGYFGFRGERLKEIYPKFNSIVYKAESLDLKVMWGIDTLLIKLISDITSKIKINKIPAIELRNRDADKCNSQLRDTIALLSLSK